MKKINKPGVIFTGALTDSPNTEGLGSDIFIPGLVLEFAANGEHLLLLAGNCAMDSQSKFLLSVAHAIFFLRLGNVLYLFDNIGDFSFCHKPNYSLKYYYNLIKSSTIICI